MARILLVDDERSVHNLVEAILHHRGGHEVHGIPSGHEALARLRAARYDLVLVDLHMPDMDGRTLVRRMRAAGHATPVVILSGLAPAEVDAAVRDLQAVGAVHKPFEVEALVAAVQQALPPDPGPAAAPRRS